MRILVLHPAFLGDTVFLGPGIRALKERWPDSTVAACVTPRGVPIAHRLPGCDEVIVYDKHGYDRGLLGLLRAGRRLRNFRPDIVLVSHPSLRTGLLARLSQAPRRIGYAPLSTERLRLERDAPFPSRLLTLTARMGAAGELSLRLRSSSEPPTELVSWMKTNPKDAILVALIPGAERATKQWGAHAFADLTRWLVSRGARVVTLGSLSERALTQEICSAAGGATLDTTGNSIDEAIAILARCDAVVGGDTGLVHCARALGRKTVVVFGPTPTTRHIFGPDERSVHLSLDCQPCHPSGPRRCPLGHHRCMTDLPVEKIIAALRELCPPLAMPPAEGKSLPLVD